MTSHGHYASQETATNSPMAQYMRRKAGVGNLHTFYSEDIRRDLGYVSNGVVIANLHELKRHGVIVFQADRGRAAAITVRVLI